MQEMQEQFSAHPSPRRTAIPGSLRPMTHREVGNAENAGAIFSPSIPGYK